LSFVGEHRSRPGDAENTANGRERARRDLGSFQLGRRRPVRPQDRLFVQRLDYENPLDVIGLIPASTAKVAGSFARFIEWVYAADLRLGTARVRARVDLKRAMVDEIQVSRELERLGTEGAIARLQARTQASPLQLTEAEIIDVEPGPDVLGDDQASPEEPSTS
jgi:hypothetical protein